MATPYTVGPMRRFLQRIAVAAGSLGFTAAFFLVLPLIQAISQGPVADAVYRSADSMDLPPPPPVTEEEPPPEEEPEEEPPELEPETEPLDLAQLDLMLGQGGVGEGLLAGDFGMKLNAAAAGGDDLDALFSVADLDQTPRPIYQPMPVLTADLRRKAPAQVYILFVVDPNGRVENPVVQSSTDPAFERPALNAVRQWKFEPGKRKGQAVRFRMRVPITFPKG